MKYIALTLLILALGSCYSTMAPTPQSVTLWALAVPPNQNYLVDTFSVVNGVPDSDWQWNQVVTFIDSTGRAHTKFVYQSQKIAIVSSIPAQFISAPSGYTAFAYANSPGYVTYSVNAAGDTAAVATMNGASAPYGPSTLYYSKVP